MFELVFLDQQHKKITWSGQQCIFMLWYFTEQGVSDPWLVGPRFTAADIALTTLLDRISFLGLAERYFTPEVRPLLYSYFKRLGTRKSVQQVRAGIAGIPRLFILRKLKKSSPFVVGALAVGIAAAVAYNIVNKK